MENQKKEAIQYIIWGIASTVLNIALFKVLILMDLDYRISNVITLIVVKIFVYVTNKLFVFKTEWGTPKDVIKEVLLFIFARGVTFVLDFLGVLFWVEILGYDEFLGKCVVSVIVVIVNYIFSKKIVFRK